MNEEYIELETCEIATEADRQFVQSVAGNDSINRSGNTTDVTIFASLRINSSGSGYMGYICQLPTGADNYLHEVSEKIWDKCTHNDINKRTYINPKTSVYYTVNTMYYAKSLRAGNVIRKNRVYRLRTIYLDYDDHVSEPATVRERIYRAIALGMMTKLEQYAPGVAVVLTGRGLGLYWAIESLNPNGMPGEAAYHDVRAGLIDIVDTIMQQYGLCWRDQTDASVWRGLVADRSVCDITRLARLPGTYNPAAGCYCHALPGYAIPTVRSIQDLASEIGVQWDVYDNAMPQSILRLQPGIVNASRKERVKKYLNEHPELMTKGSRYITLWVCASVARSGNDMDTEWVRRIGQACTPPLAESEVDHAIAMASKPDKPMRNETIEYYLGMPEGWLGRQTNKRNKNEQKAYDEITARRLHWQYYDPVVGCDVRKQNWSRDKARGERAKSREDNYSRIEALTHQGYTAPQIAEMIGVDVKTVRRQAEARGIRLYTARKQRDNLIDQVVSLSLQGVCQADIAQRLGVSRRTVRNYLAQSRTTL